MPWKYLMIITDRTREKQGRGRGRESQGQGHELLRPKRRLENLALRPRSKNHVYSTQKCTQCNSITPAKAAIARTAGEFISWHLMPGSQYREACRLHYINLHLTLTLTLTCVIVWTRHYGSNRCRAFRVASILYWFGLRLHKQLSEVRWI